MREKNGFRGKVEKALLWAATVASGCVVVDLLHREPVEWGTAIIAGLATGILNFLWNVLSGKIREHKSGKGI